MKTFTSDHLEQSLTMQSKFAFHATSNMTTVLSTSFSLVSLIADQQYWLLVQDSGGDFE
jgi:hypothetical protein